MISCAQRAEQNHLAALVSIHESIPAHACRGAEGEGDPWGYFHPLRLVFPAALPIRKKLKVLLLHANSQNESGAVCLTSGVRVWALG